MPVNLARLRFHRGSSRSVVEQSSPLQRVISRLLRLYGVRRTRSFLDLATKIERSRQGFKTRTRMQYAFKCLSRVMIGVCFPDQQQIPCQYVINTLRGPFWIFATLAQLCETGHTERPSSQTLQIIEFVGLLVCYRSTGDQSSVVYSLSVRSAIARL